MPAAYRGESLPYHRKPPSFNVRPGRNMRPLPLDGNQGGVPPSEPGRNHHTCPTPSRPLQPTSCNHPPPPPSRPTSTMVLALVGGRLWMRTPRCGKDGTSLHGIAEGVARTQYWTRPRADPQNGCHVATGNRPPKRCPPTVGAHGSRGKKGRANLALVLTKHVFVEFGAMSLSFSHEHTEYCSDLPHSIFAKTLFAIRCKPVPSPELTSN